MNNKESIFCSNKNLLCHIISKTYTNRASLSLRPEENQ